MLELPRGCHAGVCLLKTSSLVVPAMMVQVVPVARTMFDRCGVEWALLRRRPAQKLGGRRRVRACHTPGERRADCAFTRAVRGR